MGGGNNSLVFPAFSSGNVVVISMPGSENFLYIMGKYFKALVNLPGAWPCPNSRYLLHYTFFFPQGNSRVNKNIRRRYEKGKTRNSDDWKCFSFELTSLDTVNSCSDKNYHNGEIRFFFKKAWFWCFTSLVLRSTSEKGLKKLCTKLCTCYFSHPYFPTDSHFETVCFVGVHTCMSYMCEIKMAGYWPSSFFVQKRTRLISSHLNRTSLASKGFIIRDKEQFCGSML